MKPFKYLKLSIRRHFDSRKLENLNYWDCRGVFKTNRLGIAFPVGYVQKALAKPWIVIDYGTPNYRYTYPTNTRYNLIIRDKKYDEGEDDGR